MRVTARTALFLSVIVMSTSPSVAQNARLAGLSTGDVWISEPGSRAGNTRAVPEIPPSNKIPNGRNAAPAEFNFNITLTLRRNDRHLGVHAGRYRHSAQAAHRSNRLPHKFRPTACRD
jgi:hypothetical protein